MILPLTAQERQTQRLAEANLKLAVELVQVDGFVVLERVLPPELVSTLLAEFLRLFEEYRTRTDPNRGARRYQMHLPFRPPFSVDSVIANPYALQIIDALLGVDAVCQYFASDTPLPGSDYQAVHSDMPALFPGAPFSLPAFSLVVNFPLIDFTPENGPLEIWPGGTHLAPVSVDMKSLAPLMKSEKVLMPAGSVLVRDIRTWHRGTPNRSETARPNLALIYSRPWLKAQYPPINIPKVAHAALSERAKRLFRLENIVE